MSIESESCQYCGMSGAHSPECPTQFKAETSPKDSDYKVECTHIDFSPDEKTLLEKGDLLVGYVEDLEGLERSIEIVREGTERELKASSSSTGEYIEKRIKYLEKKLHSLEELEKEIKNFKLKHGKS